MSPPHPVQNQQRAAAIRAGSVACMDFITGNRKVRASKYARHVLKAFCPAQHGLQSQKTKAGGSAGIALRAMRVCHALAQHLIPTAYAHDMPTPGDMRHNRLRPAFCPQGCEVRQCSFGTGEQNQITLWQTLPALHGKDLHARL